MLVALLLRPARKHCLLTTAIFSGVRSAMLGRWLGVSVRTCACFAQPLLQVWWCWCPAVYLGEKGTGGGCRCGARLPSWQAFGIVLSHRNACCFVLFGGWPVSESGALWESKWACCPHCTHHHRSTVGNGCCSCISLCHAVAVQWDGVGCCCCCWPAQQIGVGPPHMLQQSLGRTLCTKLAWASALPCVTLTHACD